MASYLKARVKEVKSTLTAYANSTARTFSTVAA